MIMMCGKKVRIGICIFLIIISSTFVFFVTIGKNEGNSHGIESLNISNRENNAVASIPTTIPLWQYDFKDNQRQQLYSINFFNKNGTILWNTYPVDQTSINHKAVPLVSVNDDGTSIAAGVFFPELQAGMKGIAISSDGNYIGVISYHGENEYFTANGSSAWGIAGNAYDAHGDSHGQNVAVADNGSSFSVGVGPGRNKIVYYNLTIAHQKDLPFIEHDFHHAYRTYQHDAWSFTTYNLQSSRDTDDWTGVHVAISADGQYVAAVSEDSRVYYFNQSGSLLWNNITGRSLENVAMSADGKYIAVASRDHNVYYYDASGTRLWNYTTGGVVKSVAANRDGNYIAAGSDDSHVYLFDRNGTLLWEYATGGPVESVSISRNGQTIAAGSDDHLVYCFNPTGDLLWKYTTGDKVRSVSVSGDGEYVAAGSWDGNVYFFNRRGSDIG